MREVKVQIFLTEVTVMLRDHSEHLTETESYIMQTLCELIHITGFTLYRIIFHGVEILVYLFVYHLVLGLFLPFGYYEHSHTIICVGQFQLFGHIPNSVTSVSWENCFNVFEKLSKHFPKWLQFLHIFQYIFFAFNPFSGYAVVSH